MIIVILCAVSLYAIVTLENNQIRIKPVRVSDIVREIGMTYKSKVILIVCTEKFPRRSIRCELFEKYSREMKLWTLLFSRR